MRSYSFDSVVIERLIYSARELESRSFENGARNQEAGTEESEVDSNANWQGQLVEPFELLAHPRGSAPCLLEARRGGKRTPAEHLERAEGPGNFEVPVCGQDKHERVPGGSRFLGNLATSLKNNLTFPVIENYFQLFFLEDTTMIATPAIAMAMTSATTAPTSTETSRRVALRISKKNK